MAESNVETASVDMNDSFNSFRKCWTLSTADSNLTLHGFRRFKTTHLLNLRFLEQEIAEMDHAIYQAGLSLEVNHSSPNRLGLQHARRDAQVPPVSETITHDFILRLRDLLRQYDDALAAFNNVMSMETFSLLDDEKQASLREELDLHEVYNTRLLRADLGMRRQIDPFQRLIHRYLRAFRYRRWSKRPQNNEESLSSSSERYRWSYQNTVLIASIIGRTTTVVLTIIFLVAPLAIMSRQSSKNIQLGVVTVCVLLLSVLVSLLLRISSFEMMAISAAYTTVLWVFISNVQAGM